MIGRPTRACERLQDRLAAAADEREPVDLALHRHVRTCPACRMRLIRYRQLRGTMAGLEATLADSTRPHPRRSRLLQLAVAAPAGAGMAAVVTAVVAAVLRRHGLRAS